MHVDAATARAYCEGRLDSRANAHVLQHIGACNDCRDEVDRVRARPDMGEPVTFKGTKRYSVQHVLGRGGMGTVYEATDTERNVRIALKALHSLDASALFRFKREFREMQDIHHPNLVTLGELVQTDTTWFFTMELVNGVHFHDYVCASEVSASHASRNALTSEPVAPPPQHEIETRVAETRAARERARDRMAAPGPPSKRAEEALLRPALRQLARGLNALHRAGKIHRDLKPTNALVTAEGRVVLLDFGLIVDRDGGDTDELAGTAAFMSPEQAACERVGPASDWYAFGTMLFLALTGVLPFRGSSNDILDMKQDLAPPEPRELVPSIPSDLNDLCSALLRRDPALRPDGSEVLARLQASEDVEVTLDEVGRELVGRSAELETLTGAAAAVRGGAAITVLVEAPSGQGKTALVRHFVRSATANALVLSGRCYERESVAYKAMDDVIDALTRHLLAQPAALLDGLLPAAVAASAIFPVLRRVRAIAEHESAAEDEVDPQSLRASAFSGVRALLRALATDRTLLLVIDDLQWADTDSVQLMHEVLRAPDAPAMLLVATVRTGPNERPISLPGDVRHIRLGALGREEAARLAQRFAPSLSPELARGLADAASGHPLFIEALARRGQSDSSEPARLEDVLWDSIAPVPADVREVLEALSVARHALRQETLAHAVAADWNDFNRRVEILRAAHLVRTAGTRRADKLDIYHARIADAVVAHLSDETKRLWHARLASALEREGRDEPELLAAHYREAGIPEKGVRYLRLAAGRARRALAFDRAARLYGACLEALPVDSPRRAVIAVKHADALAYAGRGAEAADVYLVAAALAETPLDALELKRRAAGQLLGVGELGRGLVLVKEVMSAQGLRFATTKRGALLAIAIDQIRRRLRGYSFRERPVSEISREELMRVDTCWSVCVSLTQIDTLRGFDCQSQQMFLALDSGDVVRITQSLAFEAAAQAALVPRARTEKLQRRVYELVERVGDPYTRILVSIAAGVREHVLGGWKESLRLLEESAKLGATRSTNVTWEIAFTNFYRLASLSWMGRLAELREQVPRLIAQVESRGNLYAATLYRIGMSCFAGLAEDAPDRTESQILEASQKWLPEGYYLQHMLAAYARVHINLYQGRSRDALALIRSTMREASRAFLTRPLIARLDGLVLSARCALAAVDDGAPRDRRALLASAARDGAAVIALGQPWAVPLGRLLEAAVALHRGTIDESVELLERAALELRSADMELFAHVAELRRGELIGGDEGRLLVEHAMRFMRSQAIERPERMVQVLAPGFTRSA